MNKLRVLVGCEFSQVVCKAFRDKGHEAYSCDLLPTEGNPEWHIQDDVLKHLGDGWDLMIAHPPCTYLANSGVRWYHEREQQELTKRAADFFNKLLNAPIPLIAVENPIQHKYAREYIRIYDQIIQPWNFGDMETKAICLWLKGLLKLIRQITIKPEGVKQSVWREPPSPGRRANRSRSFIGVSENMADQWGSL